MTAQSTTPRQRFTILAGVCIALMAVVASVSGMNVAQPQLARALDASQGDIVWMINIYTVTLASLLLPLGAVGDRWGRKPVLISGLVVFAMASTAAGLAPSTGFLLGARIFCGIGAAMIMPATLSLITATFPPEERSQAIGIWTAVSGAGGILGMFVSAALVDLVDWRWLFVLPVVLVLVALPLTAGSIPTTGKVVHRHPFDLVGALTSMVAVIGFILVLTDGPEEGWFSPVTFVSFLGGVAGTIGFVFWELRSKAPLLNVRLFRTRGLASGSAALLAVFGIPSGIFLVLYPYFQAILGWSSLVSTLALMPMLILMIVCSGLAPRLATRIGARLAMAAGIFLGGAGLALMATFVSVEGGYLSILPGYLVMGLGMGLSMTPATEAITSSLSRDQQGVASALNDVAREFGSGLGIALLGAVLTAGYSNAVTPHLGGVPADVAATARKGIAGALAAATEAHPYSNALVQSAKASFVQGWQQAMWAGVMVMLSVLLYVVVGGPRCPTSPYRE